MMNVRIYRSNGSSSQGLAVRLALSDMHSRQSCTSTILYPRVQWH